MKEKRTIRLFCMAGIFVWALLPNLWFSMDIGKQIGARDIQRQEEIKEGMQMDTIQVVIGEKIYGAELFDNETAKALKSRMPMTVQMTELNGNEKYVYLPQSLPTDRTYPGQIHTGDLMLYGTDCLVLFYEDFATSYGYTPVGKLLDASALAEDVGSGAVEVTFQMGVE